MRAIFINEWKNALSQRSFVILGATILIILIIITLFSALHNQSLMTIREEANKKMRETWENMEPTNPHGAAHYGTYVFKPVNKLNSLDEGVNAVTGNVLFLEGHVQNEIVYSESSQSLAVSKFGKLKPGLFLQLVLPLILIFLSFNSLTKERESGRLKLLIIQGASPNQIIAGKIFSVWSFGQVWLILTILAMFLVNGLSIDSDEFLRLLLLFVAYSLYYFILTSLVVLLSAKFRQGAAALSISLALWILWTIFLPKIVGNATEIIHPLPSRQEFKAAMKEDRSKGIDGHNPSDEREKELRERVLAEYGVDSVEALPINFDGIVMQEDEEYGNMVWDKYFGQLFDTYQAQKKMYQWSGLVNPFVVIQNVSMGLSGTDMYHHLDFLNQAELYRRYFIKALNDEHAFGGSKTGDWSFQASQEFFRSIKDFEYQNPSIVNAVANYRIDFLLLLFWMLVAVILIPNVSKRINIL